MPRGTDFEARWAEGAWAEQHILDALNSEPDLMAVPFGISDGTAFWSSRDMEARVLPIQDLHGKRPDILVFRKSSLSSNELAESNRLYGQSDEQAFVLARKARMAIEAEFSPYDYGRRLSGYGKELSFTVKEEDLLPLRTWSSHHGVPILFVQVYLDSAHFLELARLNGWIADGSVKRKVERAYNKSVYYTPMSKGCSFGVFAEMPHIHAEVILDKYGKYTAFRKVTGGRVVLSQDMRDLLGVP